MNTVTEEYLYDFFFKDPATTEIYTLSLHDALPISCPVWSTVATVGSLLDQTNVTFGIFCESPGATICQAVALDRKSTRLNSSHSSISYAVFCLKKKNTHENIISNNIKTLYDKSK